MLGKGTLLHYHRLLVLATICFFTWTANLWQDQRGQAEAASTVVTDIRIGAIGNVTRAIFEFTERMAVKISTLKNPYRIVIDMPEVGWRLPAKPLPSASGIYERLRYGLHKPGNSRLVLILKGPAQIANTAFIASNGAYGHRLVIELKPTTKKTFNYNLKKDDLDVSPLNQSSPSSITSVPRTIPILPARKSKVKTRPAVALETKTKPVRFQIAPRKPPSRPSVEKRYTVMIDAGHGGVDPGAIGISGIYEKSVTLGMAQSIRTELKKLGRFKVVLTRDRDIFIPLRDRIRFARKVGANLFISIHADTIKNSNISGPSVYTLSERASDKEAAMLAERENKADLIADIDLTDTDAQVTGILIDLAQRETMNQSVRFAGKLINELKKRTKVLRNTHRFAGFAVLKALDVPSVLLELGFLSSPKDERALRDRRYRAHLAAGVAAAVDGYFARIEQVSGR